MGSIAKGRKKIVGTDKFAQLLLNVNNDLAATKTLDIALETLVSITTSTIGAERGTIFLTFRQNVGLNYYFCTFLYGL